MLYEMGSQLISLLLHFLFLFSLSQCSTLAGGILAPADRQVDDTQSYAAWSGPVGTKLFIKFRKKHRQGFFSLLKILKYIN
jgi:hypothetical protein